MSLDFQVRHLQQRCTDADERVHLLVQFKGDVSTLGKLGCQVTSVAGDIAAVFIQAGSLNELAEHPEITHVETSRTLKDELDISSVDINVVERPNGPRIIPGRGRGAIIGVIDSNFDLTHPCFSDTLGKTRIISAWDQANVDTLPGSPPKGFGYGVEYEREMIDENLAAGNILTVKNKKGIKSHGTYVAGIAAGNGAQELIFKGIAPEADLVFVTYKNDVPVGGSAFILDAIDYIRRRAREYANPVVINISQGDDLGAHDGKSLLERAIDNVVAEGRVLVVISAGNARHRPASRHASGKVEQGCDFSLPFALEPKPVRPVDSDTLEIWYRRGDRFAVALKMPSGWTSDFISAGTSATIEFPAGNLACVYSELRHPTNGDNHIGIILEKGEGWEAGTWELILRGEEVRHGDFDTWADRPGSNTIIAFKRHQSDSSTVTLPATANSVITVGGFVSRPAAGGDTGEVKGTLSLGSSIGPTRDGRIKPDITAPSSQIMAPRLRTDACPPASFPPSYDLVSGTSMAAPHVAGTIALLWGLWPDLSSEQIRDALYSTARQDVFTGATPNTRWGQGKLDAGAAYKLLSTQPRNGEAEMKENRIYGMQLTLERKDGSTIPLTIEFEARGEEIVRIRGVDPSGEAKYEVSLFVTRKVAGGGDECYDCIKPTTPCPPNRLVEVDC